LQESPEKKMVVIREKFEQIDVEKEKEEGFDYENLIDVEDEDKEEL
jgi:hypothetical protein